jgi:site-specific recombinase XerD
MWNTMIVNAFSRWVATEGSLETDSFTTIRLPKLFHKIPESFSNEEIKLLLGATTEV